MGDEAEEMSGYLDPVDLGDSFTAIAVFTGYQHSCALSNSKDLKCWGHNGYGECGYGDTDNRGDDSNEMGDYLDYVDIGDDFNVSLTELPEGYGGSHFYLISDGLVVHGWGNNSFGQIGNKDELGDHLWNINLDRQPTSMPTEDPTSVPTFIPS